MDDKNYKQVYLAIRSLNMRKGKVGAQCAHAAQKFMLDRMEVSKDEGDGFVHRTLSLEAGDPINIWLSGKFKKIVLGVDTLEEFEHLIQQAEAAGWPTTVIVDSGLTEFNNVPTKTVGIIGPVEAALVDKITGHLKPY